MFIECTLFDASFVPFPSETGIRPHVQTDFMHALSFRGVSLRFGCFRPPSRPKRPDDESPELSMSLGQGKRADRTPTLVAGGHFPPTAPFLSLSSLCGGGRGCHGPVSGI